MGEKMTTDAGRPGITAEMVEAGARAMYENIILRRGTQDIPYRRWSEMTEPDRVLARAMSRACLEAALADLLSNPCLAKRKPGEPIFVLLGRDPEAPDAIRAWAERRAARERVASWGKVNAARAVATEMQDYRRALTKEPSDD